MYENLNKLAEHCYNEAKQAGWHDTPREDGMMIALIHSEISEALEELCKNQMDDHLPHRPMAEVELADALIRILDFVGMRGYDLGGVVQERLDYNRTRSDHKKENIIKKF
jgi:hypothetical protein